jgi:AcrR family transcriptional regulator
MAQAAARREYRSELRQRQAGETRRRIVEAAGALFSELGYARTTLARIAERAGVSPESVQAHGPKPALLRAAIELAGLGVEGAENITDLDRGRALLSLGREQLPEALGSFLLSLHSSIAGLYQALVGGAANDPDLRLYHADIVTSIRRQWQTVAELAAERGWLRVDQPREQIVDAWCLAASAEGYLRLVNDYGWSGEQYADWLARQFRTAVLA